MPIDPTRAMGASLPTTKFAWGPERVILYHLGLGAGTPATDPGELEYTYEECLKTLPSFATVASFPSMEGLPDVAGLDFDMRQELHGEHDLVINGPIPVTGEVENRGKVVELLDKAAGALVTFEIESVDRAGEVLFVNRFSIFIRGEGRFGGERGSPVEIAIPEREPDHVIESPTREDQPLLYRLSGDPNPIHADPAYAQSAGFDRPIMHGLCTYGIVCKGVVDEVAGGDAAAVRRMQVRFAEPVYPGETIVTEAWRDEDGRLPLRVRSRERDKLVITKGRIEFQ
jgi:acyl dehydratase